MRKIKELRARSGLIRTGRARGRIACRPSGPKGVPKIARLSRDRRAALMAATWTVPESSDYPGSAFYIASRAVRLGHRSAHGDAFCACDLARGQRRAQCD